jgi:hypothetical protein
LCPAAANAHLTDEPIFGMSGPGTDIIQSVGPKTSVAMILLETLPRVMKAETTPLFSQPPQTFPTGQANHGSAHIDFVLMVDRSDQLQSAHGALFDNWEKLIRCETPGFALASR